MSRVTETDDLTLADLVPIIDAALCTEESAADGLLEQADTSSASHLYWDATRRFQVFCAASPYSHAWACKSGCYGCCLQSVPVTAVEALALADYLQTKVPPQKLVGMRSRLKENARRYAALSPQQPGYTRIPCALLVEKGMCSAYPARPLRCRGYHSLCAADCDSIRQGDCDTVVPVDPHTSVAMRGVQSGLSGALRKRGYDGRYYELNSAALRAIETPNARDRWEQGEDIFAGCNQPNAQPDDLWVAPQDDGSVVKLCRRENGCGRPEIELVHIRADKMSRVHSAV